ncbi:thioesterase II family protein [Streptomyces chrestomyceticus]|uniref:thioesterase II family protein n=1 Tax=Streptomyces chrestomyceticus TaxID=68185 RepID=UPI0037ADEE8B
MSSSPAPDAVERWLRRFHAPPRRPAARLVCLPHAGGSAGFFFPFSQALAGDLDVLAVQYPGRLERHHEPPLTDIAELAGQVVAALTSATAGADGLPLALFGHSMGALIAYEVASELQDRGTPVQALFVSGRRAAGCPDDIEPLHTLDDEAVVAELRAMDGTEDELLSDPDMLRMILPAVRADYRAVVNYRHRPRPRLTSPVVALTGDSDARVSLEQAAAWADHTTGPHELRVFPGGHFYLASPPQQSAVTALLRSRLVGGHADAVPL